MLSSQFLSDALYSAMSDSVHSYSYLPLYPVITSSLHSAPEFPFWSKASAFQRPVKAKPLSRQGKGFMIADILKNDETDRNKEGNSLEGSLKQTSDARPIFASYHRPEHAYSSSFPGAQVFSQTDSELENGAPYELPKYFRTFLSESRRFRRIRTVFTRAQLQEMEERFHSDKYLSTQDRNECAKSLGLTPLQLKTWYQNRRMKWKKEMLKIDPTAVTTRAKGRPRKGEFS